MINYLKQGKSDADVAEADAKVRATVEGILEAITKRGDDAVKELALKFDGYAPDDFRLSEAEIADALAKVSADDIDDIKFVTSTIGETAEDTGSLMTLGGPYKNLKISNVKLE